MTNLINSLKKYLLPKSLSSRLMMIIIIPSLIAQFFAVYIFYERHWYKVTYHSSKLLAIEIESLIYNMDYKKNPNTKHEYLNLSYEFKDQSTIKTKELEITPELNIVKEIIQNRINKDVIILQDELNKINLYIKVDDGLLNINIPYKLLISPSAYIFVLWLVCLTLFLLGVTLIFTKNQLKSILELTNLANRYSRGEEISYYKPSGAVEIRRAGIAFLKMKDRLENQNAKRTQMLAMISHDLKTPLTRMRLQTELMKDSEEKEELVYDIESMQRMISSYLDFARGEGGESHQELEMNSWIYEYLSSRWPGEDIDRNLTNIPCYVNIKKLSFARAMQNLISNALKYASKVRISTYQNKGNCVIDIEDNGVGIKQEDRKLVFKPFYRGEKSRNLSNFASVGLGLAITKEIIIGHHGKISLHDSQDLKGLLVRIELPIRRG